MQKEFFDIAIEGTTIKESRIPFKNGKIIVVEIKENYGSTCKSTEELSKSKYILELYASKTNNHKIIVESLPFLLRRKDPLVNFIERNSISGHFETIDIPEMFYIAADRTVFKYPLTKTDIVESKAFPNKDKYYLYKSIKIGDINLFLNNSTIERGLAPYKAFEILRTQESFKKFSQNFEGPQFIYPKYGLSEVSEAISLINSIKGYIYLINPTLEEDKDYNSDEYKHKLVCNLGELYIKEIIKQVLIEKSIFIRVILTDKQKFHGNFIAFVESEKPFKVIGLNEDSKVCPEGLQLLYFIKEAGPITINDLDKLLITPSDIITDLVFKTRYDLDQFDY